MWPIIHFGEFFFPTYLLTISLIFCGAILWVAWRARKSGMDQNIALDICFALMIGGFVGARALHVFFEMPNYYIKNPADIFKIWQGGFVFLGGAIGGFLSAALWLRLKNQTILPWADLFTPVAAMGYGLGRLACFLNGCCYGMTCSLPWGIKFPVHAQWGLEVVSRHPTQLYAAGIEILIASILMYIERASPQGRPAGSLFFMWLILHSIARVYMESLRDDFRGAFIGRLSLSTLLSLALLTIGTICLTRLLRQSKNKS